jgi:hypothetical protein
MRIEKIQRRRIPEENTGRQRLCQSLDGLTGQRSNVEDGLEMGRDRCGTCAKPDKPTYHVNRLRIEVWAENPGKC